MMNITPEQMIATIRQLEMINMGCAPLTAILAAYPSERPVVVKGLLADMMEMEGSIRRADFARKGEEFQIAYAINR